MEGACGKIIDTDDPKVVIKKIHRRAKGNHRLTSHRAPEQQRLQAWASAVATPSHGFTVLFVPKAWDPEPHQYKMERINVRKPIEMTDIKSVPSLVEDLQRLYEVGRASDIYPQDYELYLQPDGRVALVDFDKFGVWNKDGSVKFPWGLEWSAQKVRELTPVSL